MAQLYADRAFISINGARLADIFAKAVAAFDSSAASDFTNNKLSNTNTTQGVFGSGDSLTSVGGGGGVAMSLFGLMAQDSQKQTALQSRMAMLIEQIARGSGSSMQPFESQAVAVTY